MVDYRGQEVDVCIVGSGAGGGPLALELSQAGASVVVLEKGPWYGRERFTHDEIDITRRDFWVPWMEDEPHLIQRAGDAEPRRTREGWIANCVGGGTVHMSGFFHRLHPEDFRMGRRFRGMPGTSFADWPISYQELSPYYDKVEREIGVSGLAGENPFDPPRSGPYPLPPLHENPLAQLVDDGARQLGLHPFKTPRAILSQPYRGRAGCAYCDFCGGFGCETGAKSSSLAALIPRAVETDRCEVRPGSMAYEVAVGPDGLVRGVRYYDREGRAHQQRARAVCVSATSIESARLLLNSTSSRFPRGLANGSGLVGKNLTFSTLAEGSAEFEVDRLPPPLRARHPNHFLQRSIQDFYFIAGRRGAYDKGGTINYLLPHRNPIYSAERLARRARPRLWGADLQRAVQRHYHEVHEIELEVFGEFAPNDGTYVSVDGEVRDRWGIPVATIHLQNHPADVESSRYLLQQGLAVLEAAGAVSARGEHAGQTTFILQHGTCRFGDDPSASVLNRFCQAHEVPNLFVVDGSFMPTSGGVPTTLTIMANSFRVADHLKERLRTGTLQRPEALAGAPG